MIYKCGKCFAIQSKPCAFCEVCSSANIVEPDDYTYGFGAIKDKIDPEISENMAKSPWQSQHGGDHYKTMPIQPFEYSMANKLDPMQHTAIKYVTRFRGKGGLEDLRKAIHTIELLIEWEERGA